MPLPTTDAVATLIRERRTIHNFYPDVPAKEIILDAIDVACWAPNHRMTEPWRFYLIGPQSAQTVADINAELVAQKRGERAGNIKRERWSKMPGWLAITCQKSDKPLREEEDYAATACAVQNLMLYLWSQGIGMKWGTGPVTRDARFYDLLGIDPDAEKVVGLFWYGYPSEIPQACPRKPTRALVHECP